MAQSSPLILFPASSHTQRIAYPPNVSNSMSDPNAANKFAHFVCPNETHCCDRTEASKFVHSLPPADLVRARSVPGFAASWLRLTPAADSSEITQSKESIRRANDTSCSLVPAHRHTVKKVKINDELIWNERR